MPVPMAAPNRKCPRAKVAARFVYARAPRGRAGLFLVDLAIACIRATRGRAHCMRLADRSYPILLIERIAVVAEASADCHAFLKYGARLKQALDHSLARCNEPIGWG